MKILSVKIFSNQKERKQIKLKMETRVILPPFQIKKSKK